MWDICDDMSLDLIQVTADLDDAKAEYAINGTRTDSQWFRKAKVAKALIARNRAILQRAIKQKKAEVGRLKRQTFERRFVNVAKQLLPEETFQGIVKLVQAESEVS